jgi:hypothetical protein
MLCAVAPTNLPKSAADKPRRFRLTATLRSSKTQPDALKRAAAVMSLIHSARLNGHDPYAYLRDVMERLPTQPASRASELLPHCWNVSTAQNQPAR